MASGMEHGMCGHGAAKRNWVGLVPGQGGRQAGCPGL